MTGLSQTVRAPFAGGFAIAAALFVSGCMGPTYGTGTPSDQQLLEDVTGVLALGPKERERIDYTQRPDLVRPSSLEVLPTPQQNAAATNAAWPESPEQRLARVREDASDNYGNVQYQSGVRGARETTGPMVDWDRQNNVNQTPTASQREEFNRRLAQSQQGSPTERRYLSEPPTTYRQPASTAAAGDVGEDEWRKEKRERQKTEGTRGWRDYIPTF